MSLKSLLDKIQSPKGEAPLSGRASVMGDFAYKGNEHSFVLFIKIYCNRR
ncbi:hypothetical protein CLOLEP_02017 [[Clostridium] leptum DSM 753]|uniref:Uncharacterized protein n=1 Tax=[Clostridium] leptum DSM 753 TaxID=428125 RepID=A7VTX3_9FIRM|nr:hypothetical protein CLOLEP_02017 [[Clostridium] leptum DSM 753]